MDEMRPYPINGRACLPLCKRDRDNAEICLETCGLEVHDARQIYNNSGQTEHAQLNRAVAFELSLLPILVFNDNTSRALNKSVSESSALTIPLTPDCLIEATQGHSKT